VVSFFFLASSTFHATHGYNLNENDLGDLVGDRNVDSLFGWSLQHFNNELYVGAPGKGGAGAVYQCTNIDAFPNCKEMSSPRLMQNSWYGGSLAGSGDDLYTCSFRHGYTQYNPQKQYIGKCFKKNGNKFDDLINFSGSWSNTGGNTWKTNGIYGVSATVSDKSGNLVVGTPITFDNKGMWNNPYISVGSIGLISKKGTLKKPTNRAPWITTDTDTSTMKNTFKNAGYSLGTGSFFTGNPKSYIVGAPKANNYRGSVYICNNCFDEREDRTRIRVRFPESSKNLEVVGLQIGEGFGISTAACDITGDGRDDLIVGAPNFSPGRRMFNVGRIHIFLKFTQGTKELRRVWPDKESTIGPSGDRDENMGAKFGSAVACLGDTDGDGSEEVVVGAPFFNSNGAIFLYRAKQDRSKGLVLTQIIKSKDSAGFGMKLSLSKLKDFSSKGFAIGAPAGSKSTYVKVRNVPRFTDITRVTVMPRSVDPQNTQQILVKIRPAIQRRTEFTDNLIITANLATDSRLNLTSENSITEIGKETTFGRELIFSFKPSSPNFGLDPRNLDISAMRSLAFKISLEYKLEKCSDSYTKPCPVFDPEDKTGDQVTDIEKKIIRKKLPDQSMDFNICKDTENCLCDVTAKIEKAKKIVAGATTDMHMGDLIIENKGTEPAFYTNLEITIDKNMYMFVPQGNCFFDGNLTSCDLPFFNSNNLENSKRSIPLKLSPMQLVHSDTEFVKMKVKLSSKNCKNKREIITEEEFPILVEHEWKIKAEQRSGQEYQNYFWEEKIEQEAKEESETVELTYKVLNEGPSMSKESKLYAFVPGASDLIENIKVSFSNNECSRGDLAKNQIPPQPPASSGAEMIVCQNRGDCHVYECNLPKAMEKQSRANLQVKFDFVKKSAKQMEKVSKFEIVTSICTMSHKEGKEDRCVSGNKEVLRTTTSFEYIRKTTLDLLINSWQMVLGGVAGLIVFFLVFVIFWKCELFKKVRIYKNMEDTNELMEEEEGENQQLSEIEVDGQNVELRS